jgi:hypothetical protein
MCVHVPSLTRPDAAAIADVDPHHFRTGIFIREICRLVGAATSNEDVEVGFVFPIRP